MGIERRGFLATILGFFSLPFVKRKKPMTQWRVIQKTDSKPWINESCFCYVKGAKNGN